MNITVELKSVNHRYFEFASKIPRNYGFLDDKIKKYIQTRVARGKIDCYISIEMLEAQPADVVINHTLAAGYVKALTELAKVYDLKDDITATAVARYPEIFSVRKAPEDEDKIFNSVKQVLDMALDGFKMCIRDRSISLSCCFISNACGIVTFDTITLALGISPPNSFSITSRAIVDGASSGR